MNAQTREAGKCSLALEVLQSQGWLRLRTTGASMLPTLWPGDLLTIQSQTFEQVEPGDIVLWTREGRFFVHRVVRKPAAGDASCVVTRGDSMLEEDQPAGREELLGKVIEVRHYGSQIVPGRRLSPFRHFLAQMLCRWSLGQRLALRLHAYREHRHSRPSFAVRSEAV